MANHICKICNEKPTKYGFQMCYDCYNEHYKPRKDDFTSIRDAVVIIKAELKKEHDDFWDELLNG